jgi:hypothetical protein
MTLTVGTIELRGAPFCADMWVKDGSGEGEMAAAQDVVYILFIARTVPSASFSDLSQAGCRDGRGAPGR